MHNIFFFLLMCITFSICHVWSYTYIAKSKAVFLTKINWIVQLHMLWLLNNWKSFYLWDHLKCMAEVVNPTINPVIFLNGLFIFSISWVAPVRLLTVKKVSRNSKKKKISVLFYSCILPKEWIKRRFGSKEELVE